MSRALGLDPATPHVPLGIVVKVAVIGVALALHASSASAQTARKEAVMTDITGWIDARLPRA